MIHSTDCELSLLVSNQIVPHEGLSLHDLEVVLNRYFKKQFGYPLRLETTSTREYIAANTGEQSLFGRSILHRSFCLIDVRARLEMTGSPLATDAQSALAIASWEGGLQRIANMNYGAAKPVEAILVPDTFRPLIVTWPPLRSLAEHGPEMIHLAQFTPAILAKFMECFDGGLYMFKLDRHCVLLDVGTGVGMGAAATPRVHFNDWGFAAQRLGPSRHTQATHKFIRSDIMSDLLFDFLTTLLELRNGDPFVHAMFQDWEASQRSSDVVLQWISMFALMHMFLVAESGNVSLEVFTAAVSGVSGVSGAGGAFLKQVLALVASPANQGRVGTLMDVVDRFCNSVLLPSYFNSLKFALYVE